MKTIVIATSNDHKLMEITHLFQDYDVQVKGLKDLGLDNLEIIEDGDTFLDNARIKVETIAKHCPLAILGDDSGLCVDALNGGPGVHTARFFPEAKGDYKAKRAMMLELLKDVTKDKRQAHFTCAMVYKEKDTMVEIQEEVHGFIHDQDQGEQGFGYDGIFYYPELKKTFGQLEPEEKDAISHRGRALKALVDTLVDKGLIKKK